MLAVLGVLALISAARGDAYEELNECTRGVRRAHPTQENIYQVFVRNGWRTQWLDRACPRYHIYDHQICGCIETLGHPPIQSSYPTNTPRNFPNRHPPPSYLDRHTAAPKRQPSPPATYAPPQPPAPPRVRTPDKAFDVNAPKEENVEIPVKCDIHRPHSDPSKYERLTEAGWMPEDCNWPFYTGLVWDQAACRCEWGPNRTEPRFSVHDVSSGRFLCLVMLNMTFDQAIKDDTRSIWISQSNADNIQVIRDAGAVGGGAALFQNAFLKIPYFKSNTLGSLFHISFRFKPCEDSPDTDLILLHNGCEELDAEPTLSVAYRAWSRVLIVEFQTSDEDAPVREECEVKNQQLAAGWTSVNIHYEKGRLDATVNGMSCISSSRHLGEVKPINCALSLPGEDFCGYLDEVLITRNCPAKV